MKKMAFSLAAAAVFALPALGHAQVSPVTATINATAKVQSAVSFSNPQDLDFGDAITPGSAASVAPGTSSGKIQVTYNVPTTITVTGTSLSNGGASLGVTYKCAQDASGTATTPTTVADCGGTGFTTSLVGNTLSNHWIFVGGDIAASETTSAPAGSYTGTVTFTATFTTY